MDVWRVNLREQSLKREAVPEGWSRLGGRGLSARILLDEVPATCEPLGRHNKLVLAPGLLVGHMLTSCDRISFGAKSPMTRGIKEANAGGSTGLHMTNMGMKALILEEQGQADGKARSGWWVLHLSLAGARFEPADDVAGLGVHDAAPRLLKRYGDKVAIALIGPAGEMRLSAAGVQNLDKDRVPARIAARGGLGAVMGSKRLKAIVFDDAGGKKPPIANREAFKAAQKLFTNNTLEHPQTKAYQEYGTPAMVRTCNAFGALPTRNFSTANSRGPRRSAASTCGTCSSSGAARARPRMPAWPGASSSAPTRTAATTGRRSSRRWNTRRSASWVESGHRRPRHRRPVELGGQRPRVDTIDMGAALGVAAEAGLMEFGTASGRCSSWRRFGRARRWASPRARGGDGGAGARRPAGAGGEGAGDVRLRAARDQGDGYDLCDLAAGRRPHRGEHRPGQGRPSGRQGEHRHVARGADQHAGFDTLGACIFAGFGFMVKPEVIPDLLNARYGWQVGADILQVLGKETITLEREFNRRAGFTAADDRIPEYMRTEPLPPHNAVYDASDADLDSMFNW